MAAKASYVQEGFHTLTPYLHGGLELVDFLKRAFGAEEIRTGTPDASGRIHCELKIGDSPVLVGNGYFTDSSMAAATWIYVPDVDACYKLALKLGGKSVRELAD